MSSPKGVKKINWLKDEECKLVKALAGVMMLKWDGSNQKEFWDVCSEALERFGNEYLSKLKGIYFNRGKNFNMLSFAAYVRRSQGVPLTQNKLWQRGDKAAKGARDRERHLGEWKKIERQRDFWLDKLHVKLPKFSEESASNEYESESESESSYEYAEDEIAAQEEREEKIQSIDERFDKLEYKLRKKLRRVRISMESAFRTFRQELINSIEE